MTNTEAVIDIVTVNKPAIVNPHRARAWLTDRCRRRQRGKGSRRVAIANANTTLSCYHTRQGQPVEGGHRKPAVA
jgi:hypothetical protein